MWSASYSTECADDYARMCGFDSVEDIKTKHPNDWETVLIVCIAKATGYFIEGNNAFFHRKEKAYEFCRDNWLKHAGEDKDHTMEITANIVV